MAGKRRSVYLSDRRLAQWQRLGQPPLGAALGIGFDVMEARAAAEGGPQYIGPASDPLPSGPHPDVVVLDEDVRRQAYLASTGLAERQLLTAASGHAPGCQHSEPHFFPAQCVVPLGQLLVDGDSVAAQDAHQAGCVRLDPHFANQCAVPFVDPDGRYQGGNT